MKLPLETYQSFWNVILHLFTRIIVRCRLRFSLSLCFLPALNLASVILNVEQVTPSNASELGFIVSVVPDRPRTRVRVTYPQRIGDVWIADRANVLFKKAGVTGAEFLSVIELGPDNNEQIVFQFDDQHGTHDATVIVYYSCDPAGDEKCGGFEVKMYHLPSVLAHLDASGRLPPVTGLVFSAIDWPVVGL